MVDDGYHISPARRAVVETLRRQARRRNAMQPMSPATDALDPRDARLAIAIHRTVVQRWLTLEHLLDHYLSKPLATTRAALQAALLSGAAQMIFMDKLPAHAVVHETVEQAKAVRKGFGRLTNAVLRKLADVVGPVVNEPWSPAADRLPHPEGYLQLKRPMLGDPARTVEYLAVATSHPEALVQGWLKRYGEAQTRRLLLHDLQHPPTFVFDGSTCRRFEGTQQELTDYLAAGEHCRVQDPTSAKPVAATAGLSPNVIVDYCAGLGTKSRQVAAMHPQARIIATDIEPVRMASLEAQFADHPRIVPLPAERLHNEVDVADLLLLDVPCSNTGVLARRLEARYRCNNRTIAALVGVQQRIITDALAMVRPGGHVLYATCSIEPTENEQQTQWAMRHFPLKLVTQQQTLPGGEGDSWHDGGYFALMQKTAP